jgi:hypothetical protein
MALHQGEPLWVEAAGLGQMSPTVRVLATTRFDSAQKHFRLRRWQLLP